MIPAFSANPTIATKHEEMIGKTMLAREKASGHTAAVPHGKHVNQYDPNFSQLEKRVAEGKHTMTIPEMARAFNVSQYRIKKVLETQKLKGISRWVP